MVGWQPLADLEPVPEQRLNDDVGLRPLRSVADPPEETAAPYDLAKLRQNLELDVVAPLAALPYGSLPSPRGPPACSGGS